MNEIEAAKLLLHSAAFDNRQPSKAANAAWAAALHDVPADVDAYAAVARYYGTASEDGRRLWLEPHHVRSIRRQIRNERHGETIAAYHAPDPDESGPEFVQRRREQLTAIGDGRLEPTPVRHLAGGPHPSVAGAIEGGVRLVDDALDENGERPYVPHGFRQSVGMRERPVELSVPCPPAKEGGCGARERQPCVSPRGRRRETVHAARQRALQQSAGGESA